MLFIYMNALAVLMSSILWCIRDETLDPSSRQPHTKTFFPILNNQSADSREMKKGLACWEEELRVHRSQQHQLVPNTPVGEANEKRFNRVPEQNKNSEKPTAKKTRGRTNFNFELSSLGMLATRSFLTWNEMNSRMIHTLRRDQHPYLIMFMFSKRRWQHRSKWITGWSWWVVTLTGNRVVTWQIEDGNRW